MGTEGTGGGGGDLATVKEFVVRGDSKEKAIDGCDGTGRAGGDEK